MSLSVFKPVNRMYYRVEGYFHIAETKIVAKSPDTLERPTNRRYRQSELVEEIARLESEIENVICLERAGKCSQQQFAAQMKYLEAVLKQKQKHLVRLQKNVVIQKSIRSKKRNAAVQQQ